MLFGAEPAAIGDDRVDLAIVGDVAKWLREIPGRLRVCRIALVKDGERRREQWIAHIFIKLGKLPRREQAFVDDRLRRERADVAARRQERFGALTKKREMPLKTRIPTSRMEGLDEELPNFWHGLQRQTAEGVGVDGNTAPA